jgi:PPOX class probable F420-dependent enzyme
MRRIRWVTAAAPARTVSSSKLGWETAPMLVSVLKPAVSARFAHSMSPGPVAPGTALGRPIPMSTHVPPGRVEASPGRREADATSVGRVDCNTRTPSFTAGERERVAAARVARLATVRPDGRPHVVPVTFAPVGADVIVTAVDHKPKRTHDLQRLRNIEANPEVSLLVDHYDEDWTTLWWVRVDAAARVVHHEPERSRLVAALVEKYAAYAGRPPEGPVVVMAVHRVASWNVDRASR